MKQSFYKRSTLKSQVDVKSALKISSRHQNNQLLVNSQLPTLPTPNTMNAALIGAQY